MHTHPDLEGPQLHPGRPDNLFPSTFLFAAFIKKPVKLLLRPISELWVFRRTQRNHSCECIHPTLHIMRHLRAPGLQVRAPVSISVQFTTRVQRNCLFYSTCQFFIFFLPNCLHLFGDFDSLHGYDCRFLFSSEPLSYSQLSIIFFFF